MVEFSLTCPRHQEMFTAAARRGGCCDPAKLDELRRKTLAWVSTRYPLMVLDHFNEATCLGCKLEVSNVAVAEILDAIVELAKALAGDDPQRPPGK